jgi:sterol desaturase/sphingolipid hydroxylase (fatty acid hydroxylase superfamily)
MNFPEWIQQYGDNLQLAVFVGFFITLALLERLISRRARSPNNLARWGGNLRLTIVNVLLFASLPVSFVTAAFWAEAQPWGLLNLRSLPLEISALATLLLRGFIAWGTHILNHKVPFLWRFHRIHHLDTEVDVSTTLRVHPVEFVLNLLIGIPLVVIFGLTPWALMLYEVFDALIVVFSHSNVRFPKPIDSVLKYIIVTPDLHRIHHSSWRLETDSNYGPVFPIWDLLLGTFRGSPKKPHETMVLGLGDNRGSNSRQALWLLISPFRNDSSGNTHPLQR